MNHAKTPALAFSSGFKHQVREVPQLFDVKALGSIPQIDWKWLHIKNGILIIDLWYGWDGCSGPTWDNDSSMRGSLLHDALTQLMRQNLLDRRLKPVMDQMFHDQLIADGFWKFRADYYLWGVTKFGRGSTLASHRQKIKYAP